MPQETNTTGTTDLERPTWLTNDVWPFAVRTYHHGGRRIHYVDEGDGPPVVLVHAGFWSFIWRDLIVELRSEFRCLALDFPGAGLSDGTRGDVDLALYADLLDAWLHDLAIDRAMFVVHDLGGVVGVTAAARSPERVDGLVAINAFAWPPDQRALRGMLRIMGSRPAAGVLGTMRVIPRMSRSSFGVGKRFERADKRAFFAPYRRSRGRSRNFHRTMRSASRSPELFDRADRALRTTLRNRPALTVFGEKNDPFGFAESWRERFPNATAHVIENGNHFPMCDAPGEVAGYVRTWYASAVAGEPAA